MRAIGRNCKSELKQNLPNPISRDNGIKTDVVCCLSMPHTGFVNLSTSMHFTFTTLLYSRYCAEFPCIGNKEVWIIGF